MRALMLAGLIGFTVLGCGPGAGTYCQSGPKYGTQCYTESDVSQPTGSPRPAPDSPRKGEPPATPPSRVPW